MLPDPLHPAVVHFPIAFAYLLPPAALVALLWGARARAARAAWVPVAVLMVLTLASGFLALQSGETTHERVEKVVDHALIEAHEERAEGFMVVAWVGLALAAAGFLRGRLGVVGRGLFILAALLLAIQITLTGKLGGALVYEHGAASAYSQPAGPPPAESDDHSGHEH